MSNLDPNKQHIYNLIIIDESGSMFHLAHATLAGVNETINTIRSAQKQMNETQQHFLTLVTFDTGDKQPVRTLLDAEPIDNVKDFADYAPTGSTPLYDAIGQSVSSLYNKVSADKNANVVVTIVSDGLENSSVEYSGRQVKALIERMKAEGWSFSYMGSTHDVKGASQDLSIDNFLEFSHDNTGASSCWRREMSAKIRYYERLNEANAELRDMTAEARVSFRSRLAGEYYGKRVTPEPLSHLNPDEVFVFGSNKDGRHLGGASLAAFLHFGAVMGRAEGLQGQSYAIPTVGVRLTELSNAIERFIAFAEAHNELHFMVTAIGCGSAGFTPKSMAPLFEKCIQLENVSLPASFWMEFGIKPGEML